MIEVNNVVFNINNSVWCINDTCQVFIFQNVAEVNVLFHECKQGTFLFTNTAKTNCLVHRCGETKIFVLNVEKRNFFSS
jgi:hypothetical protein